jgi:hypothetical protein
VGLCRPPAFSHCGGLCRPAAAFGKFAHRGKHDRPEQRQFAHHTNHHLEGRLRHHLGARRQIKNRGLPFIGSPQNPPRLLTLPICFYLRHCVNLRRPLLLFPVPVLRVHSRPSSSSRPLRLNPGFDFGQLPVAICYCSASSAPFCVNLRQPLLLFFIRVFALIPG